MIHRTAKLLFFLLLVVALHFFFTGCSRNPKDVDLSKINVNLMISRFDRDIFSIPPDSIPFKIQSLRMKYGNFFDLFCTRIINIGPPSQPLTGTYITGFVTDFDIQKVAGDCNKKYPDLAALNSELTIAFKRYRYFFPDKAIPRVITFISGFNFSIVAADSILGIGLDMYLGKNYPTYQSLAFPEYRRMNMESRCIAVDAVKGWLMSEFQPDASNRDLINAMIYYGKIYYCSQALFPDVNDSLIAGYSTRQDDWCKKNEAHAWAFFIDKKLLYSTASTENMKYVGEGPFTAGMPQESPGGIGKWIGWRIVMSYMSHHSDISVQQLMAEMDAQKILINSKYKPSK